MFCTEFKRKTEQFRSSVECHVLENVPGFHRLHADIKLCKCRLRVVGEILILFFNLKIIIFSIERTDNRDWIENT